MSYLDIYKKRMGQDKSQILDFRTEANKRRINDNFTITQGHKKAYLTSRIGGETVDIDIVVTSSTTELEKTIFFKPEEIVTVGSYITYNDKTYIMREIDYDQLSPKSKCYLCNQKIKFKDWNIEVPCYTNSTTYGSKGIVDQDKFYELDSKTRIYIQRNEYTDTLKVGQRIMFANMYVYKITEIDDMVFPGMYIAVAAKDETLPMDDFVNNIAYNKNITDDNENIPPMEAKIIGEEKIKINKEYLYTIDLLGGTWEVDEQDLVNMEQEENSVKIVGLKTGWVSLSYIIDEKVIDTLDVFIVK